MNKLLIALAGTLLAAGAALAADAPAPAAPAKAPATYYWLHPKLGMVKVERDTGFMVVARKQSLRTGKQPNAGHDHARTHKPM